MDEPETGKPIRKALVGHKIAKGEDGRYTFTISSGSVDRDRDTIAVTGWQLENYRKNPVVLFGHNRHSPPIGRAEKVGVQSGALKADVEFAPAGVYPLADTVRGLVDADILRATSVAFMSLKWTYDEERGGVDFLEQELYEFSIVPVPSNTDALRDTKGVDLAPLVEWAEFTLDTVKGAGLWVAKDAAARWLAMDAGNPKSITVPAADPDDTAHFLQKKLADAGGVAPGGSPHAAAVAGSSPAPATPEPEKAPAKSAPIVLRLVKAAAPAPSLSLTPEQIGAAVQSAVKDAVQAGIRHASGRLE